MAACWSDMVNDVLEHITSFLPLPDRCRFSAVCKSWREIIKQNQHPPAPQLPWLVLNEESETKKRKFYSLSEDRHYSIDIPELYGRYICGSSFGWLFAVDIKLTAILINPFTRERIELPPLLPYDYFDRINVERYVEREPDDGNVFGGFTHEHMQVLTVFKAVLSHDPRERSGFIIVILFGNVYRPAFWRPGDTSWTIIEAPKTRMEDVIFFGENCYVVSGCNEVFAVEFESHPKMTALRPWPMPDYKRPSTQVYLAVFDGALIILERFHNCEDESHVITNKFEITEPHFEKKEIYEWYDIDGYAFFVGPNSTIVIDSSQFPGCKSDSIYFTFPHFSSGKSAEDSGFDDLAVFDMISNTISSCYRQKYIHTNIGAPIWFTPNP